MQNYELTRQAEADLLDIWYYTAKTWDKVQADRYFRKMEAAFEALSINKTKRKPLIAAYKNVHYVRCERHYIFFLTKEKPVIVAILHEKMDFLGRLKNRMAKI